MAKATPVKKTPKSKTPTTKKSSKKAATTKAVSNRGRKVFDGKSESVVCAGLIKCYEAGYTKTMACREVGISTTTLDRYLEKNDEFREYLNEVLEIVNFEADLILNDGMRQYELAPKGTVDRQGNKIKYVPSSRAINIAKYRKRALDPRYAPKQFNANMDIPPPAGATITPEREAEIAAALKSWEEPEPEPYEVK